MRESAASLVQKRLDEVTDACIIPPPCEASSQELRTVKENTMKRAIRMLILMVGLACTYVAIATPILNAELGPMPLCPPSKPNCAGGR